MQYNHLTKQHYCGSGPYSLSMPARVTSQILFDRLASIPMCAYSIFLQQKGSKEQKISCFLYIQTIR